ncbi:MAG: TonB-dependent receptor [Porphyromonadaceae bacterium]|nr:TonB-dependent receptor [Porphyromonadaceae bacterium]
MRPLKLCCLVLYLCLWSNLHAQHKDYSGTIAGDDGIPLIGVSVLIKNTTNGTVTDIDGKFNISALPGDYLVFSYIGYETVEVLLTNNETLSITMRDESIYLDEMVVVGYGQMKKSDLTAAISSVKSEDLIKTSITSIDQGLQGRAAGVVVTNISGQPGAGTSIRIRGTSSVMGTNEPLYVIDGIPVINGGASSGAMNTPPLNPMALMNPNDVESIEVLKDASATAIYGARGANGVILVTTKRGNKGKIRTSANAYFGIQSIARKMDMLNAEQLAILGNEATDNANIDRKLVFSDLNNLRKRSTDWQNEIFRLAPIQNYELAFSGGSDKSAYFLSTNFFSQDGIILGSDYKKGSLRFNLDQELSERIKIGNTMNITYSQSNGVVTNYESAIASSITSWALEMNPGLTVRNQDGTYVYENNISNPAVGNPVEDVNTYEQLNKTLRITGNMYADFFIVDELRFRTSIGIDYYNVKDLSFAPIHIKRGEASEGIASVGQADGYTWVWENTLSYDKIFAEKHSVNALVGTTAQQYEGSPIVVSRSGIEDGRLGYHSIQEGTKIQLANTGYTSWQMLSYLARVNYGYDSRYLLTLTGRVDGSSKFGTNNKYGFFPSTAFAWRMSEEAFMKEQTTIDNLKVRASYGLVGNEGISPYSSMGLLQGTEAYIGTSKIIKGQAPYTLGNQDLKWETTAQFNIGFDIGIYKGRYSLSADYYIKKTKDLLLTVPTESHIGYDMAIQNVGNLENKGFDFTFNATPVHNSKFSWESNLTFGLNRNKVTNLPGNENGISGISIMGINYWTKIMEGKAIGTIYGYKTDGIAQLDEDLSQIVHFPGRTISYGDRKYVNKDGTSDVLNEDDLFELGNANPDFTYGWNNTFSLKLGENKGAVNLNLYLQGVQGNSIANFNLFSLESFDGQKNNSIAALKRWAPDNPTNDFPRANASPMSNVFSDHQVEDGSYLRIKDVTLSYDFPANLTQKFNCNVLQVYISAKNMHTFTKYSGYDPEVSRFGQNNLSMGADYGSYPVPKLYMLGLKMNF